MEWNGINVLEAAKGVCEIYWIVDKGIASAEDYKVASILMLINIIAVSFAGEILI